MRGFLTGCAVFGGLYCIRQQLSCFWRAAMGLVDSVRQRGVLSLRHVVPLSVTLFRQSVLTRVLFSGSEGWYGVESCGSIQRSVVEGCALFGG